MSENAHGTTTRAQSLEAPAAPTQILRACTVKMQFADFERHECTVNSSELAGHARAPQRSKHSCLTTTVSLGENNFWKTRLRVFKCTRLQRKKEVVAV